MAVGDYAKLAGLRARLFGPAAGPSANDGLLSEICGEVNDFIESTAERVLAPLPTFSSTVDGSEGATTIVLGSAAGLAVGDDLMLGLLDGDHEVATVQSIVPNLTQSVAAWESGDYDAGDIVEPTEANGHTYRCVTAGTTSATEPDPWPEDGTAVVDGMVVWLDLGLTSPTIRVRLPLQFSYGEGAPCQRILVADGVDAVENRRCLLVPIGVLTLAGLELGSAEDKPFRLIDAADYFLQPGGSSLRPGFPRTEVWLSKSKYPQTWRNVRLIGPGPCAGTGDEPGFGFPKVPEAIRTVAYNIAAARWQMRATGGTYDVAPGTDQLAVGQFIMSKSDWIVLQDYARGWGLS